jgi:hypothetical protein
VSGVPLDDGEKFIGPTVKIFGPRITKSGDTRPATIFGKWKLRVNLDFEDVCVSVSKNQGWGPEKQIKEF